MEKSIKPPFSIPKRLMPVLAIVAAAVALFAWLGAYTAPPDSMEPAIYAGERVLIDKVMFRFTGLRKGDIIVYRYPGERGRLAMHRVAALPGETIELKDQGALIDGEQVKDAWGAGKRYYNHGDFGKKDQAVKLPRECYFVLGDYSSRSDDSRFFGFLPKRAVVGTVIGRYYPFKRMGRVK